MADFKPRLNQTTIDPQERSRRLAQVYSTILSWPDPRETETEPVVENLDGSTAAGSASKIPTDANIPIDSNIIQEVSKEIQTGGSFNSEKGNNHG